MPITSGHLARRKRAVALFALTALLIGMVTAGGAVARTDTHTSTRVTGITVYAAASLTGVFPKIDSGP